MTKKLIILKHLRGLDGNRLEHFKKALCELKPPPGAGPIRMENIENISIEEIVEFIFRCHTERHGATTIKKVLKEINENQIRMSIEKDIRNASKSKGMEGTQVSNIAPTNVLPTYVDVPCSEPSTKKLKRDQDGNAVPGALQHKEATASKSEGHRPVHSLLKKEPQPQVSPKLSISTKGLFHTAHNKQFGVAVSHAFSTEPEPQVDLKQGNNTTNQFPTASAIPFGILYSNASSKKLQLQGNPRKGNTTSNISHTSPKKPFGKATSHVSSKDSKARLNLKQNVITNTAPTKNWVVVSSSASKEPLTQVSPVQGNTSSISHTASNKQYGVASSHASSKKPKPQGNPIQGNIASNISHTGVSKQIGIAHSHAFNEWEPQVNSIQGNISHTAPSKQLEVAPSKAFKVSEPQVKPIQGNLASNISHTAPSKQLGVAPSTAFKDPEPQVNPIQSNIASNMSLTAPSKQLGVAPSNAFKEPEPQEKPIQSNIASNIPLTSPIKQLGVTPSNTFKEPEPQVKLIQSKIASNISLTAPSKQLGVAPSYAFTEPEPQVKPIQSNIASNISLTSPIKQMEAGPFHAFKDPEPQVKHTQSNIASNISLTSPSKQLGVTPSNAFKEPEPQVKLIQSKIASNISLTSPSKQMGVAPSYAFKESEPQVKPIQSNIASNISLTSPIKQMEVAPSNAFKEPEPQVKPIQSNIASNISLTAPSKQLGVTPSNAFKEPEPQVKPIQSNIASNISLTAPSKQLGVAPSNAFKETQPQVNPFKDNITSNISHTAPSKQLGVAPSHAFKETQPQVNPFKDNITSNISHTAPSKQLGVAPSHAFKEHSQTEKSLPNTSVEKETRDILATHLKTLGEDGIARFKEQLCLLEPPLKGGKIQTRHVKEKSVEDMVDLIIRCHTMRHARATVRKVLARMKENNIKMLIEKDFRKSSPRSNLNMFKQKIIIKDLKNLDAGSLEEFKNALCCINPPRGCEQMTMNILKDKSLEDMVQFILKYYTQRYGPEMIKNALNRIGKDKIWKMIQNDFKEGAKRKRKMENEKKKGIVQFVKHHALDLIREVAFVDLILTDLLSQKLLTKDQYDKLYNNTTSQKKMRELYKFVSDWSDGSKVTFYESLMKHNKELIKYLEHQDKLPTPHKEHFVDRHQQELIKGMTSMVELIISHLRKERLLKKEQFHKISTKDTPKEKMEMLYCSIKEWDITRKNIFYDILKKLNGQIISLLEEKGKKKPLKPNFSEHFVDRHCQDLINWVYELQPILDSLQKQNLLSKEQYESICSKINSQEKMRDLYNVVRGWGDGDKDTLYETLGKYNRLLIRDLEYQDMGWPLQSRSFSMSLNQSKWTHKHLLLYTLEYLLLEEFKHFTKELSDFTYKDRPTIPFGMIENEDSTSLSDKLINHYGEFTALDVTNQVLKSIGLNGFAVELQDGIHLCGLRRPEVILTFIMDELEQFDFRLFKDKLSELHKEDKHPIPKRLVDSADRITTTDLLIWIYGEKEAMRVTVQILWELYRLVRSEKVERLTRDLENWISTQGISKQDFREGEVAASKLTDESFASQPGSSQDFDFQVDEKAIPDQSEQNSASHTGPKHRVSSKEENTQSCRMTFDLKNEMKCSVCLEVFTDPTTLMCGHNFCMKCIEKSWNSQQNGKYTCPNCKHKFEDKPKLKVNCALREVARIIKPRWSKPKNRELNCAYCTEITVDAVKSCLLCEALLCNNHLNVHSKEEEHILIEPTTSFKERKCFIHNKVLEHFCTDDDVCVCSSCCIYGEHRDHQVEKVTKAAEKKKNDLRNVQKELTYKEKNIEELLKCCSKAQMASDTKLSDKLLEVLELKVPGDTSTQEGWALFSVPDLIKMAEKRKSQLSQKIDNIKKCQEMDPILFLQDLNKELFDKSFQCQTVDILETLPKAASISSHVDEVDRDPCEKNDDLEKMHLTSRFSESFQSNEDVLDISTGGSVSSIFESQYHDDTLTSYPGESFHSTGLDSFTTSEDLELDSDPWGKSRNHDDTLISHSGESLHSIDLDNLSGENSVSSLDSDKVDWGTFDEDNDPDKNLLSCSRESLQFQGHALKSLSEESSISSQLDEVDCNLCGKDNDPDKNLLSRSRESLRFQGHALKILSEESSQLDEVDCNLCGKDHDPDDILIDPEINGNTYKLELTSAGLFRCSKTGIKFQVRHPVTMEYELDSWYNYMECLQYLRSEVVGPLFNIKTPQEPDIVSAVYLPHYMCLKELSEGSSRIICAHFKDGNLSVEKPARILPFHVVLENPSFSPLGTLWHYLPNMVTKHIPIHGKVLLYFRVVGKNHVQYQIHLYLVPIFTTMSKDLEKEKESNGFEKIDKPSRTTSRIYTEKKFIVKGPKITHVMPKELEMLSISPLENVTEIIINAPVEIIELRLVQKDSEENVWGCLMCTGELEMLQSTIPNFKRREEEMDMEDEQQTQPFKKAKVVSPPLTQSEQLQQTLQQITQEHFEEFKMCLKNEAFLSRIHYDSMRTSELENKNAMEVSDLLIRRYTKERALPLTILVLERIGEKQLAKNLRSYIDRNLR